MKLHQLIQKSYDTFWEQLDKVRVILLHPRNRYRSVLVAQLINDPHIPTFYYAMGPDDINIHAFMDGITHDLANQHPTFGRHVNMLPDSIYENFIDHAEEIMTAFARDLSEISTDERFLFILDEYDRSDSADDVQYFMEKLPEYMPSNCRLVINSRTLPRLSWIALIVQGLAALLEDDHIIREAFYGIANTNASTLDIYVLGAGFVHLNDQHVDTWEGHLPRLLLFFALDRPVVTRSDICRAFWPELSAEQAVNVFHVTKRRLHKALNQDVLLHQDGFYRLNPEIPVYYDVLEFAQALLRGRDPNTADRVGAWQTAIDLYRGPFLQTHEESWIRERRIQYRVGYIEALSNLAEIWLQRDRPEQALALYQKATAEDPLNEAIHRAILQIYASLGRRSEAAAYYQALIGNFQRERASVSPETDALYKTIMT